MKTLMGLALACALAACASAAPPSETSPTIGRLYHYLRSNQDGSLPEHIYQYRAGAAELEVGKQVEPCTNAAFVTAEMDLDRGQGLSFTGGRLQRDGTQAAFAWLSYDAQTRRLNARVPMANVDQSAAVAGEPYILYDFDLADFNAAHAGRAPAREDFRFAVSLIWPVEGADSVFRDLGWAEARFAAAETHLERPALRFDVSGGLNGALWLDRREGHVLEARFAEPNHTEYSDFRMVLQSVEDDAEASWAAVRAAHWAGCPSAPN
jgi:hypothetical protein